jgi:hypothetical protein
MYMRMGIRVAYLLSTYHFHSCMHVIMNARTLLHTATYLHSLLHTYIRAFNDSFCFSCSFSMRGYSWPPICKCVYVCARMCVFTIYSSLHCQSLTNVVRFFFCSGTATKASSMYACVYAMGIEASCLLLPPQLPLTRQARNMVCCATCRIATCA